MAPPAAASVLRGLSKWAVQALGSKPASSFSPQPLLPSVPASSFRSDVSGYWMINSKLKKILSPQVGFGSSVYHTNRRPARPVALCASSLPSHSSLR